LAPCLLLACKTPRLTTRPSTRTVTRNVPLVPLLGWKPITSPLRSAFHSTDTPGIRPPRRQRPQTFVALTVSSAPRPLTMTEAGTAAVRLHPPGAEKTTRAPLRPPGGWLSNLATGNAPATGLISAARLMVQDVVAISRDDRLTTVGAEPRATCVENVFVFASLMLVISPALNV